MYVPMYVCLMVALCDYVHGKGQHQLGQGERSFKEVWYQITGKSVEIMTKRINEYKEDIDSHNILVLNKLQI